MDHDFILHHHDPSPFAEKIRKAFGIKGLAWRSVQIPMVMPKPGLTELTGGYRGTPVLQIGADIYCDTRRIIAEIEARAPTPPLLGAGPLINFALQHWSDDAYFAPGAALSMYENADQLPQEVIEDREAYFHELSFSDFAEDAPHFRAQIQAHAALIDRQLSDGRTFLCGDAPQWVDLGAWHNIFMASGNIPSAASLYAPFSALAGWVERMQALGHGDRTDIEADAALDVALGAEPAPIPAAAIEDPSGRTAGEAVRIVPDDHKDTVVDGELARATPDDIVILRRTPRVGTVAVHFPRIGYAIRPAG
ncbi:MAG: glutathione S-transferase [Pseudomonadota bacterium]